MTEAGNVALHFGDNREVVAGMAENTVDAIVTDPPYGLKFMGKEWDHGVPGVSFWESFLRVAKPGAHLLAFGGTRTHHRLGCAIEDAGWEMRDCVLWLYGSGFPKSHNVLKPAWEPIWLARKPLDGTVANNVLTHGVGGLNIDVCRVGDDERVNMPAGNKAGGNSLNMSVVGMPPGGQGRVAVGRWPANVILDEVAAEMLDGRVSPSKSPVTARTSEVTVQPGGDGKTMREGWTSRTIQGYGDSGGPSRFFYCPKASKAERTANGEVENKHPTVKPIALMRYLCRLVCPPNGLILDPFMGSGSTIVAAMREGFRATGIELDYDSYETAQGRIGCEPRLFTLRDAGH